MDIDQLDVALGRGSEISLCSENRLRVGSISGAQRKVPKSIKMWIFFVQPGDFNLKMNNPFPKGGPKSGNPAMTTITVTRAFAATLPFFAATLFFRGYLTFVRGYLTFFSRLLYLCSRLLYLFDDCFTFYFLLLLFYYYILLFSFFLLSYCHILIIYIWFHLFFIFVYLMLSFYTYLCFHREKKQIKHWQTEQAKSSYAIGWTDDRRQQGRTGSGRRSDDGRATNDAPAR